MADSKNGASKEGSKEGFLGRWSQRKQDIRDGKPLVEPEIAGNTANTANTANLTSVDVQKAEKPSAASVVEETPEIPLPTMADVHKLTAESDFSPFVAKNVSPDVRNTAMKKLFTDPHYNVMDRLDIYIDDYSKPDPIPESMLRQMVSAKFLNLFKAEEEAEAKLAADKAAAEPAALGDDANTVSMQSVAQSSIENLPTQEIALATPPSGPNDDHSDLRLQQNHAAGPHKLGRGAE
jgi:Protein of unknown function (DUF3306)